MGFLPNVTSLRLSGNQFSGAIPSLLVLTKLTELWLQDNQLTGNIPVLLSLDLTTLYLHNNRLEGSVDALVLLAALEEVSLYDNPRGSRSTLYDYDPDLNTRSGLHLVVPPTGYAMCLPSTMGGDDCTIPARVDELDLLYVPLYKQIFARWKLRSASALSDQGYEAGLKESTAPHQAATGGDPSTGWAPMQAYYDKDDDEGRKLSWYDAHGLTPGRSYDFRVRTAGSSTPWLMSTVTLPEEPPSTTGGGDGGSGGGGSGGGSGGGGFGGGGGPRRTAPDAPRNLTAVGGDGEVVLTWDAPEDDGGAEISDYEYRVDRRNPWISTGSTDTTHTVSGLVNGTTYTFEVRAVNRIGTSSPSNRVEATPEVFTLGLPHFANGEGVTSEVVLLNVGTTAIRPALYFFDRQGEPIAADSVVDVTGDLEVADDGGLRVRTAIEPLGELTVATHGRGEQVSGSVKVVAEGRIGGVLRYRVPGTGVTGVGTGTPVRDALFPARRKRGDIRTAAALHNPGEEAIEVTCELMSEGAVLEEATIPLAANGQTSWFIEEAFTETDTTYFAGTVRCTAAGQGRFAGLAVEVDQSYRTFTTLPLVPVDRTGGSDGETELDFPHFANGTWVTDLVFVNPSVEASGRPPLSPFHPVIHESRPEIYFYDTGGALVPPASLVDLTADLEVTDDGALTTRTAMEPLGVLTISTHGRGELVTGSVRVVSVGPIGGMLRFEHPSMGVAAMGAGAPVSDAMVPVRRQEGGINTGVALHNLESSSSLLRCELLEAGVLLDSASIPLAANGQTSWSIDQAFPATDTSDFLGSLRCASTAGGSFTAVALEMDPGKRIFTTLPVVEMPSRQ